MSQTPAEPASGQRNTQMVPAMAMIASKATMTRVVAGRIGTIRLGGPEPVQTRQKIPGEYL